MYFLVDHYGQFSLLREQRFPFGKWSCDRNTNSRKLFSSSLTEWLAVITVILCSKVTKGELERRRRQKQQKLPLSQRFFVVAGLASFCLFACLFWGLDKNIACHFSSKLFISSLISRVMSFANLDSNSNATYFVIIPNVSDSKEIGRLKS